MAARPWRFDSSSGHSIKILFSSFVMYKYFKYLIKFLIVLFLTSLLYPIPLCSLTHSGIGCFIMPPPYFLFDLLMMLKFNPNGIIYDSMHVITISLLYIVVPNFFKKDGNIIMVGGMYISKYKFSALLWILLVGISVLISYVLRSNGIIVGRGGVE